MTHRTEDPRMISWTVEKEIIVGYHDCGVCRKETPEPSMDRIIVFAQSDRGHFMWPAHDEPGCTPTGWRWDGEEGWLCPDCVEAMMKAFTARRKPKNEDS